LDLLLTLLNSLIEKGNPPGTLSIEYAEKDGEEEPLIRLEWLNGVCKDFPWTRERYDLVWARFQRYWLIEAKEI
jgi:hypothetical protein